MRVSASKKKPRTMLMPDEKEHCRSSNRIEGKKAFRRVRGGSGEQVGAPGKVVLLDAQ